MKKTKTLDEDDLKKNFKHTSRSLEAEKFRLIIRKGICRYGYMNNLEKFEETRLPSKDALYSRLNLKSISDQDYEHAKQVWNIIEEKILGCYHDTYLRTDVLLLADVFETFRDTCLSNYKLDSAQFYTAP